MEDIFISNQLIKPSALESEIHPLHKPAVYDKRISPCRELYESSSGGPPGAHCVRRFPDEMHMQPEEGTLTGKEIIFAKAFIYQS